MEQHLVFDPSSKNSNLKGFDVFNNAYLNKVMMINSLIQVQVAKIIYFYFSQIIPPHTHNVSPAKRGGGRQSLEAQKLQDIHLLWHSVKILRFLKEKCFQCYQYLKTINFIGTARFINVRETRHSMKSFHNCKKYHNFLTL